MRASTASSTPRSPAPKTTAGATISPAARANEASAAERAAALQRSSKAVFPYPRGRPPPPTAKPPAIGKPTSCCSPDTAKPCSPSTIAILGCCWHPVRPPRRQRVSPHISWRSSKHSHQGCDALSPSIMAPSSHAISCSAVSPSRLTSAIPMPLGRRVASKTPSVGCAASSRAKPISPLSPTSVSTTSSAAITTPLENALTSQPRRRSSKKCCTSTVNPPSRLRGNERSWPAIGLLQPHHNAVGRALGVHDGEAHETRPFGREEERAAARLGRQWHAVDQHRQGPGSAADLERDRVRLAVGFIGQLKPGAVGREHDAQRGLGVLARQPARPKALLRRRQFAGGGPLRAGGRGRPRPPRAPRAGDDHQ